MLQIINPYTEEIIGNIQEDTKESLAQKLEILKSHQSSWNEIELPRRIEILKKFADLLKQNIEVVAPVLSNEMGKPLQQSKNEVNGAANRVAWLCDHALTYLSPEIMTDQKDLIEKIVYEPLGVICNISAWNYPYNVGVNVFVPALLAGNAVMYKPSEYTMLTGQAIEKYLKEAGVPDEIFKVAYGGGYIGDQLLDMPFDGYFFTGSYKTGKYIYERVASKMVPCQLELGGKDPVYVTDDIQDIKNAAAGIADGAFYNNGQSCCAVERVYVQEKVYDQFVKEFIAEVQSWKSGNPFEAGTYITVVSRKQQLDIIDAQIKDAVSKGAKLEMGGNKPTGKGYQYQPTILTAVNHTMDVMNEESFGPVIGIMKVKDDTEAIQLMNDNQYGLTAAVYSSSKSRAEQIMKHLDAGTVYWNCCDRVSAPVPWSGRKHSGFGSTLSHAGLRAFTQPKAYQMRLPG